MRASGVLFFFWLLLIVAGISQLRSEVVLHYSKKDDENVQYAFVSYIIYYTLAVLMFLLNCFADLPPKDTPYKYEKVNIILVHKATSPKIFICISICLFCLVAFSEIFICF